MTKEEIKDELYRMLSDVVNGGYPKRNNTQRGRYREAVKKAIEALEQEPCDKSAMLYEIYMNGVNMSGEYQGCWVRFKDIEKIVDEYMAESEDKE